MTGSWDSKCIDSSNITFPSSSQAHSPSSGIDHAHGLDHLVLSGKGGFAAVADLQLKRNVLQRLEGRGAGDADKPALLDVEEQDEICPLIVPAQGVVCVIAGQHSYMPVALVFLLDQCYLSADDRFVRPRVDVGSADDIMMKR